MSRIRFLSTLGALSFLASGLVACGSPPPTAANHTEPVRAHDWAGSADGAEVGAAEDPGPPPKPVDDEESEDPPSASDDADDAAPDADDCPAKDCAGACTDPERVGDGSCDADLACPATDWDLGDCNGGCLAGQVLDCFGGCTPESAIGDGECDERLRCRPDADGGDCLLADGVEPEPAPEPETDDEEEPKCAPGELLDCAGGCASESRLGDGVCDPELDCDAAHFDGYDCAPDSDEEEGESDDEEKGSCGGRCGTFELGATCQCDWACVLLGNCCDDFVEVCDDGCGPFAVPGCDSGCVWNSWVGDDICDENLSCAAYDYDQGDCPAPGPDSCVERCGAFDEGAGCQCDEGCADYGDCCENFTDVCEEG